MHRCVLLALPLALVLAACGASHRATSVPHTELGLAACFLRVYFAKPATPTQEQAIGAKLRQDPRVKRVAFISKAQALAEMKKRDPGLVKMIRPGRNPLPDSFTVVPVTPSDLREIGASIAHRPGVAMLKLGPCRRGG